MTPLVDQLENIAVRRIDVEHNRDAAYEYGIRGVPTLILTVDGEEVRRHVGLITKEQLEKFIND